MIVYFYFGNKKTVDFYRDKYLDDLKHHFFKNNYKIQKNIYAITPYTHEQLTSINLTRRKFSSDVLYFIVLDVKNKLIINSANDYNILLDNETIITQMKMLEILVGKYHE